MKKVMWTVTFMAMVMCAVPVFAAADETIAAQTYSYSEILPADSVVVVSLPSIEEVKALFADPSIKRLMAYTGIDKKLDEFKEQFNQHLLSEVGISLENLYDSFAGDLTFALMNFTTNEAALEFAVMAGIKGGDDEALSLIRAFAAAAEENDTAVQVQKVEGRDMIVIDGHAYFAAGKGHIILSNRAESITKLLGDKKTLNEDPVFNMHRKLAGLSKGFSCYANLRPILDTVKSVATAFEGEKSHMVKAVFDLAGLDYLDSISLYIPLGEKDQIKTYIHAPDYSGILTKIFSGAPVGLDKTATIPDYFDGFFALSIKEPLEIMNSIIETISMFNSSYSEEEFQEHFDAAKEAIGVDVKEDLIAPFGSTIAGGIKIRPDFEGKLAKNPFAAFMMFDFEIVFALKQPAKLLSTMLTFTEMENVPLESEAYNGGTVFSFPILGANQTFCMAIVDDNLIMKLGDSSQMKLVIDAVKSNKTIATSEDFNTVKARISPNACMFGYYSRNHYANLVKLLSDQISTEGMTADRAKLVDDIKRAAADYFAGEPSTVGYGEVMDGGFYSQSDFSVRSIVHILSLQLLSGQFSHLGLDFDSDHGEEH